METTTAFENISQHIIQQLTHAEHAIQICVAWLTDEEILETLIEIAKKKIFIEILTLNDEYNRAKAKYFNRLISLNCKVYMIDKDIDQGMLHHKFCIIDREVLITGSYNWSKSAKFNNENILINVATDIDDMALILNYENEFTKLLYEYGIKNEKEENKKVDEYLEKQDLLINEAKECYDIAHDYLINEEYDAALEFINEAISKYTHRDFFSLRFLINFSKQLYLESAEDLFLYLNEIASNDEEEIQSFKKSYNLFILGIKNGKNTYKLISAINQKTKSNLGAFSALNTEPHFFSYEELKPFLEDKADDTTPYTVKNEKNNSSGLDSEDDLPF
ncbi:MAG: phospholipase D-like domain-containing protein [Bacteroidales bacterium]|jgi:hypothetical protein